MRLIRLVVLLPFVAGCCDAQTISSVLNGASYSKNLAPGTWAVIFGTGLAPSNGSAASVPLPILLMGVSVTVGGIPAPLSFVSPAQINVLIPFELGPLAPGSVTPEQLTITTPSGSATVSITLNREAPAIFTTDSSGSGNALVFDANFRPLTQVGSAPIIFYATGLGPVALTPPSASGASLNGPSNPILDGLVVELGYQYGTVQFAGLAPGLPGVYQINVLPNSPPTNVLHLDIVPPGGAFAAGSNQVTVPWPLGANVSKASGSITSIYPSSTATQPTTGPITFSELPQVLSFSIDLQMKPNAQPFDVVAVSTLAGIGGEAIIHIDPTKGTWQSNLPVPTAQARSYDFSNLSDPVWDFTNCSGNSCLAFPGKIVPLSRVDPLALAAVNPLPMPTAPTIAGSENAIYATSGALPADGHFVMSASFGVFSSTGLVVARESDSLSFRLFADGLPIGSGTVVVQVQ